MKIVPIGTRTLFREPSLIMLVVLVIVCAAGLSGCAPGHQQEDLAGVSVPIPAGMKKNSNSSDKIDISNEQLAAQASFRGKVSAAEIQRFYLDVLPAADWEPDAKLGEALGGYAFKRGDQVIAIRVQEGMEGNSTLIVLAKNG